MTHSSISVMTKSCKRGVQVRYPVMILYYFVCGTSVCRTKRREKHDDRTKKQERKEMMSGPYDSGIARVEIQKKQGSLWYVATIHSTSYGYTLTHSEINARIFFCFFKRQEVNRQVENKTKYDVYEYEVATIIVGEEVLCNNKQAYSRSRGTMGLDRQLIFSTCESYLAVLTV